MVQFPRRRIGHPSIRFIGSYPGRGSLERATSLVWRSESGCVQMLWGGVVLIEAPSLTHARTQASLVPDWR
jgi:hypothetical protein